MLIVDAALAARAVENRPIRVGVIGAGFLARSLVRHIAASVPGIRVCAIANRTLAHARDAFAGRDPVAVESPAEMTRAIASGFPAITSDPDLLTGAPEIEVIVEATGSLEFAAGAVSAAIAAGKHVVMVNAELDATVGPILKRRADRAGAVYTGMDGDQPGAIVNLARQVATMGLRPVLGGNIKGLLDHARTPETQAGFAAEWGVSPALATSAADGTKIAFEQAVVANHLGFGVLEPGMTGPEAQGVPVEQAVAAWAPERLLEGPGWVDYVLGATPGPGVFVLAELRDPDQRRALEYYKMGKGPLYCFVTPYHLGHLEVPATIARAALFGDAAVAPRSLAVEVVAIAKRDLAAGETLDGPGGFLSYGAVYNAEEAANLLPMGLSEGCRVQAPIAAGKAISRAAVSIPAGRRIDALRAEQARAFPLKETTG